MPDSLVQQRLFRTEMVVPRRAVRPRQITDLPERRNMEFLRREDFHRGIQDEFFGRFSCHWKHETRNLEKFKLTFEIVI